MTLEPAVPLLDPCDGFAERLMVSYGDMHRIQTTRPHLAENLLRPVGVLQVVDAMPGHEPSPLVGFTQGQKVRRVNPQRLRRTER